MFGRNKNELDTPPISEDNNAFEILRVWGGENLPQQFSLNTTWDDPGAWGLLLVDMARHTAKAYENTGGISEKEALNRIKELLDSEWNAPSDVPEQIQ